MVLRPSWRIAALLILCLGPETAFAQSQSSRSGVVQLRFDWPKDLRARVTVRQRVMRPRRDVKIEASRQMTVTPESRGLRVSWMDSQILSFEAPQRAPEDEPVYAWMQAFFLANTGLVVAQDGTPLVVEGVDHVAAITEDMIQPALDSIAAKGIELGPIKELSDKLTSEQMISSLIAGPWRQMVSQWSGTALEVDAVYEATLEEPSPLLPDQSVTMQYQIGYLRWVPCTVEAEPDTCVRIEVHATPEPESLERLLRAVERELSTAFPDEEFRYEDFSQEIVTVLVTEPSTLMPHYFSHSKTITGAFPNAGALVHGTRLDAMEMVFEYQDSR
jgi:hypothetical protein